MEHPFLARITCANMFGTGILVAPDRVLTCAHVATRYSPDTPSTAELLVGRSDITVHFPEAAGLPAATCRARVIDASHQDLALLALEEPCPREPLRVYRLAEDLIQSPGNAVRLIAGFTAPDDANPTTVTFEGLLLTAAQDDLIEFQTAGGLAHGMSGSPLLTRMGQTLVCLGLAFRGGRGVSHSRFVGPGPMLAFLRRSGIDAEWRSTSRTLTPVSRFDALGKLVHSQRNRLGISAQDLARRLRVAESEIADWETGRAGIAESVRQPLWEILVAGHVPAVDEWLRLTGARDPLVELRALQSTSTSCELIQVHAFRSFEAKSEVRPAFRTRAHVSIHVQVPHPSHVTFISVDHVGTSARHYEILGLNLLPEDLPAAGLHRLPKTEPMVITDQTGPCSLVMLAWPLHLRWDGIRPASHTRVVTAQELQASLDQFQRCPPGERHVSIFDYDVR